MSFDRAEQTGLGVAFLGHLLLFGILSAGYLAMQPPPLIQRQPIEVSLVDEVGLESGAPEISTEAPAPKLAELEAPIEREQPTPPEPAPAPQPKAPQPKAEQPKQAPKQKAAERPRTKSGGRLDGLLEGLTDSNSPGRSTKAPASRITPAVQSSLAAEVRRQLKPHWRAPTGADADKLRTELSIRLAPDGSVVDIEFLRQSGVTPSNSAQAELHKERAMRAVRLAAPFQLPREYYDAWKHLSPIGFDKRLSQ
jgi:hypothetical protein